MQHVRLLRAVHGARGRETSMGVGSGSQVHVHRLVRGFTFLGIFPCSKAKYQWPTPTLSSEAGMKSLKSFHVGKPCLRLEYTFPVCMRGV